ncbi:MAG: DUF192 domain-containing protein, partial [Acidimicrobiales bacterium]
PARSVHTLGMRFTIDVAFLDAEMVVLDAVTMEPWRVGLPRVRARSVLEASGGAFERWRLKPGDKLEVRGGTACAQPPGGKSNGAAVRRTAVPAPAKPARQPGAGRHADRQPG